MRQRRISLLSMVFVLLVALAAVAQGQSKTADVGDEHVPLKTEAGKRTYAQYRYLAGTQPKTAFVFMHPRLGSPLHFALEPLARRGFGALGVAVRAPNVSPIHEELMPDIAAAITFLKSRGVEHVILAGHSGGGSLFALYQAQAETAPPNRLRHTPAGDPPDLNQYTLPKADGLVTLNAHSGEGEIFTTHLDPSVTDEADPFSYDGSLDAYNPANGFRVPPGATKYSPEFVARFRKGQQDRARRLADIALSHVRAQNYYRGLMKTAGFRQLPPEEQLEIERRAAFAPPMTIYRGMSDVRYYDLSLDPSDRVAGRFGTDRVDLQNWSYGDQAVTGMSARAFLSTLSILSNAKLNQNLARITVPVLITSGSADTGVHASAAEEAFKAAASKDKEKLVIVGGEHSYEPAGPKAGKGDQQEQLLDAMAAWARKRWAMAGS